MDVDERIKIKVKDVSKSFLNVSGKKKAIDGVSFSVKQGEFVAILGTSGCGKSTLLNMIAGLVPCDQGSIEIDEQNLKQPERHRMMMFQESALFPWYSVVENVMYGLRFKKGLHRNEYRDIALFYLMLVGLKSYADARIYQLSGGMKQRVALARALAPNPEVLLMDEPFSALDASTCEHLYKDVQKIWQNQHKTILFVTHNIREAIVLAQRIIVLSPNPGRVIKEFPINLPYPRSIHDVSVTHLFNEITQILHSKMV